MRRIIVVVILIFIVCNAFSQRRGEQVKYNETYRNQFHFSPKINKLGSPIALWEKDSLYHLYFQYNPHNLQAGYINWGHAVSTDLIRWKQKDLVLSQPSHISDSMLQVPWWGSVASHNSTIVAWYNNWDDGVYKASVGSDFSITGSTETIGIDTLSKCEPFVFWHSETQKWIMFAYNRPQNRMHILNSENGITWNETSAFNYSFGFPQMIKMPVNNMPDNNRWVLFTEGGTYMLGDFDGEEFEIKSTVMKFNYGNDIGGSVILNDTRNERFILLSEVKSLQMADIASNGFYTIPSVVSLHDDITGTYLRLKPVNSIETLNDREWDWIDQKIIPGISRNNLLRRIKNEELHIKALIQNNNSDLFGFLFRVDRSGRGAEISYDSKKEVFNFFNTVVSYTSENKTIEFEIFLDRSSIEVFIDGGKVVFSNSFSPSPDANEHILFTKGGEIMVKSLDVKAMQSAWRK